MDELERIEVDDATDQHATADRPPEGSPTIEHARIERNATRPPSVWIAVAAVLTLLVVGLVAWRASLSRDPKQTNGLLLGEPGNTLGYDRRPGNALWLNIAGPKSYTFDGDRTTAGCTGATPGLVSSNRPGRQTDEPCQPNPDLDRRGHLFVVRVTKPETQRPLLFDVADPRLRPSFGRGAGLCATVGGSTSSRTSICAGDIGPRDTGFTTTFIVRAPDSTPDDPTDNPAICAATFKPDATARPPDDWERMCAVPADRVQQGDYIVQVRSNADLSAPRESRLADLDPATGAGSLERADPAAVGDGQNHFALRAQWDGGPDENRGQGLTVDGLNHLVTFVNQRSSYVTFPVVHLDSAAAGRRLRLTIFDLGDLASNSPTTPRTTDAIDLRVAPPSEALVGDSRVRELSGCRFVFEGEIAARAIQGDTCTLNGVPRSAFNGKQVTIELPVPAGYTCEATLADCWVNVQLDYHGLPNDNVEWTAEILDANAPPATAPTPR